MKKNKPQNNFNWLVGLIFLSPVIFSTRLLEMDNLQKLAFFILSIPAFIYLGKGKEANKDLSVDLKISIFIFIYPLTFLTSIINSSLEMLLLQLTYLLPAMFIVIFILFVVNKIGEEHFFKISSLSIIIVSTLFSFIGLLQVMDVDLIPLPQIIIPGSTIGHRGFAAEFLLPAIPFLFILKKYVNKDYYTLLLFAGIINLSFLFFTRSRSALGLSILILAAIIAYVFLNKNIRNKIKTLVPFVGVYLIAFLLSVIPPLKGERADFSSNVTSVVDSENRSNILRMNFLSASLEMIKENPLTGVGLQMWSGTYPKYYGDEFVDSQIYFIHAIHSHNDFLELFAENGFAAPIIYSLILLLVIYNLYKKSKSNENYFFVLLSALSTVGFSFIAFPMSKFSSYFFLAFASGLAIFSADEKGRIVHISFNKIKWLLAILIVIGIITSYIRLNSELSYIKAIEYRNGSNYKSMLGELENVNSIFYPFDPSKQPVEFYRAIGNYHLGRLNQALIHSIKSEKVAPNNPLVLHNTAAIYQSSNKYDKAVIYYERMRTLFPNYIDPQINLLIIYSEIASFEQSKQLFNELMKKDSLNSRLASFKTKFSN